MPMFSGACVITNMLDEWKVSLSLNKATYSQKEQMVFSFKRCETVAHEIPELAACMAKIHRPGGAVYTQMHIEVFQSSVRKS